jgi:hypothetical protein
LGEVSDGIICKTYDAQKVIPADGETTTRPLKKKS